MLYYLASYIIGTRPSPFPRLTLNSSPFLGTSPCLTVSRDEAISPHVLTASAVKITLCCIFKEKNERIWRRLNPRSPHPNADSPTVSVYTTGVRRLVMLHTLDNGNTWSIDTIDQNCTGVSMGLLHLLSTDKGCDRPILNAVRFWSI